MDDNIDDDGECQQHSDNEDFNLSTEDVCDDADYEYEEEFEEELIVEIDDCLSSDQEDHVHIYDDNCDDCAINPCYHDVLQDNMDDETVRSSRRNDTLPSSQFYSVLTEKQVLLEQQSQLESVLHMLQLLDMPFTSTSAYDDSLSLLKKSEYQKQILYDTMYTILKAYQWKTEKLFHDYLEFGDGYILDKAGIVFSTMMMKKKEGGNDDENNPRTIMGGVQSYVDLVFDSPKNCKDEDTVCVICMDDDHQSLVHPGTCSHEFCQDCWYSYISVRVTDNTSDTFIPCMNPSCSNMLSQSFVHHLLATRANNCHISYLTFQTYLRKRIDGYVQDNPLLRWCSSTPFCGHAIKLTDEYELTDRLKVECVCGKLLCFKCGEHPHEPATCEMVERWKSKVQEESASVLYFKCNTAQCPKCKVPVEKAGGCSHMRCSACGHSYCWECRSPLSNHSNCYQKKLRMNHSREELERLQNEIGLVSAYFEYIEKYAAHSTWINEEESTACHSSKLRSVIGDDDFVSNDIGTECTEWVDKIFCNMIQLKQYFVNCCIFAFHVFEMEDREAEEKVKQALMAISGSSHNIHKSSSAKKKSSNKDTRIKKMKYEMQQQLEKKRKNTAIYQGLFLNMLEQLDNRLQSIMLLLNDMYLALTGTSTRDNNSVSSMKREVDLLLSLAKTIQKGLEEVISDKDMKELDR